MLKNYISLSLLCCFALTGSVIAKESVDLHDKLLNAIETSDVLQIKKLIRRIGAVTEEDKKIFLEAAEEVIENREKSVTLLKSPWDLGKLVSGLVFSTAGGLCTYGALAELGDDNLQHAAILGALATLGWSTGLYGIFKGVKCSTASKRREVAEAVEGILEAIVPSKKN